MSNQKPILEVSEQEKQQLFSFYNKYKSIHLEIDECYSEIKILQEKILRLISENENTKKLENDFIECFTQKHNLSKEQTINYLQNILIFK